MFALETPRWGFCKLVALQMLSHGQFRISFCLDLDCVPGVCSLSGIQAGKSVRCGRSATEWCSCSACMLGRSAQHFTSCAPGSDQRQQVSLNLSASMQIEATERVTVLFQCVYDKFLSASLFATLSILNVLKDILSYILTWQQYFSVKKIIIHPC